MIATKYIKSSKLGEGTYGKVFLARDKVSGQAVAIKVIQIDQEMNGIPSSHTREISILSSIDHKNVIKLIEFETDPSRLQLVLEFMPKNLGQYILASAGRMKPEIVQSFSYQLLCGLAYLHSVGVMHRDINPENILINNQGILKIADFGSARQFSIPLTTFTLNIRSSFYKSPELIIMNENYTPAIDIWSAGCVIAEMVLGHPLFRGDCDIDQIMKIVSSLGTPTEEEWPEFYCQKTSDMCVPTLPKKDLADLLPNMNSGLVDLLKRMLEIVPDKRITAREALQHRYFDTIHPSLVDACLPVIE